MKLSNLDLSKYAVLLSLQPQLNQFIMIDSGWQTNQYGELFQVFADLTVVRVIEGIEPRNSGPDLVVGLLRLAAYPCKAEQLDTVMRKLHEHCQNFDLELLVALSRKPEVPRRLILVNVEDGTYKEC